MISFDKYIIEFVNGNSITLYVLLTTLKGIALATKNVEDDKIVTLLSQLFYALKNKFIPKEDTKLSEIKT